MVLLWTLMIWCMSLIIWYMCNNPVSVFTCGGQFVTSYGRKWEGKGEFLLSTGLAVDNSGVVYVCYRVYLFASKSIYLFAKPIGI